MPHSEEKPRQALKMEDVRRLTGEVAHDLNNMLTAIIGSSEILLKRLDDHSPLREKAELIGNAGKQAALLTKKLLTLSRKQMLQPKIPNLNTMLAGMETILRCFIGEHIDLAIITSPELGDAKADPGQISQVIINLVANACDAMSAEGKITIETANKKNDLIIRDQAVLGSFS